MNIVDQFGVIELYQTKQGAVSWFLNSNSNNSDVTIHELSGSITKKVDRGFNYFSAPVAKGGLASDGSRYTFRIDIRATGEKNGSQKYNYQTLPSGIDYLNDPSDIGDAEFTIIIRRRSLTGEHICGFKMRGGDHHDSSPDASDFGIGYPTVAEKLGEKDDKNYLRFFEKELIHSSFDYFPVAAQVATIGMPENTWVACKAVTYVTKPGEEVMNQLWVDQDPIDFSTATPTLKNNYQKVAEYVDKKGLKGSAGTYTTAVTWKGCTWSIRIDNAGFIDYASVSLRSINPILNNNTGGGTPPPPPPPGGGGGGGGGTQDTTPILAKPKTTNYIDSGGQLANPLNVHIIYWGAYWNGTITAPKPTKAQIDAAITRVFGTRYFYSLFQYRFIQVPELVSTVVNTTFAPIATYTAANMESLIDDCKAKGLIPVYNTTDDPTYLYLILSDPTHSSSGSATTGSHGYGAKYMYAFVNSQADLPNTTRQMTKQIVNAVTDNKPVTAININPAGAFSTQTSNGHEVVSVCDLGTSYPATGFVDAPPAVLPTLSAPAANNMMIYTQPEEPQYNPFECYFIFAGSTFASGGSDVSAMNTLLTNIQTVMNSHYFEYMYQYNYAKKPIYKGSVVNTTYTLGSGFSTADLVSLITDSINRGQVPTNTTSKFNVYHIVVTKQGLLSGVANAGGWHQYTPVTDANGNTLYNHVYAWIGYLSSQTGTSSLMYVLTHEMTETFSDFLPFHGYILSDQATNLPAGVRLDTGREVADACQTATAGATGTVSGVSNVAMYYSNQTNTCVCPTASPTWMTCPTGYTWNATTQTCDAADPGVTVATYYSDEDGLCIAPDKTDPVWISCPAGSNWNPATQTCDPVDTSGGGGDDGGGNQDVTLAGQGGGAQGENALLTVSKDWTGILNVGIDTADQCTAGNPLADIPLVATGYDVKADAATQFNTGTELLGFNFGDGMTEVGLYINTSDSILFDVKVKQVTVNSIKRLINESGQSCSGVLYCIIYNYPSQQIMAFLGDQIDVSSIDINYQSLVFTQKDNEYRLKVGDMILIHYYDITASPDRCLVVGRTVKDTIDGVNSFLAIRAPSQYYGNASEDPALTIMK